MNINFKTVFHYQGHATKTSFLQVAGYMISKTPIQRIYTYMERTQVDIAEKFSENINAQTEFTAIYWILIICKVITY